MCTGPVQHKGGYDCEVPAGSTEQCFFFFFSKLFLHVSKTFTPLLEVNYGLILTQWTSEMIYLRKVFAVAEGK